MGWIIAALVLGIFLNMSTAGGVSWSIGSVVAVVMMGIYIKTSQDKNFEELKSILKGEASPKRADNPAKDDGSHTER